MKRKKGKSSDHYAPYRKCDNCGVEKHDWSFRYQGLCSDCHRKWLSKRTKLKHSLKLPNANVEIEKNIITQNVLKKLEKEAHSKIPFSKRYYKSEKMVKLIFCVALAVPILIWIFGIRLPNRISENYGLLLGVWFGLVLILVYLLTNISMAEEIKRFPIVKDCLKKLARQRKQRIDETEVFYASAEWKLLRKEIIQTHGRVCKKCGVLIVNDEDVTVDHVRPRRHYPELALEKDNLQVLCRMCNSKKKDKIIIN